MLRSVKKAILQNPIVLAAPLQTRLESRPVTVTLLSPRGFSLDSVQKVALGILLVPTAIAFVLSLISADWTLFFITGFMLMLLGLVGWIIKLRSEMAWKVTWHQDAVEVEDGRYDATQTWVEPLAVFTGLEREFGLVHSAGRYASGRRVYGLLLAHPDPSKSVLLHATYDRIEDDLVAYYGEQLGKTLLDS